LVAEVSTSCAELPDSLLQIRHSQGDAVPAARLWERPVGRLMRPAGDVQQEAEGTTVEHGEDGGRTELLLESEKVPVETNGGIDVVDEVTDRRIAGVSGLIGLLDPLPERGRECSTGSHRDKGQAQA